MVPPIKGSVKGIEITTDKQADSVVDALDQQERKKLLDALNKKMGTKKEKKETKETIEKIPELEKKNFRIDSKNWQEITAFNGVKVKENPEGDVREYLEGDYKGEQLFTQGSALREASKVGKRLPASWTTYRDIINTKYEKNYQDFIKGENILFSGRWFPNHHEFLAYDRNIGFNLRCADGSYFNGGHSERDVGQGRKLFGFSVRCLKD